MMNPKADLSNDWPADSAAKVQPRRTTAQTSAKSARRPENLDWKRSIVDLMKLAGLDSSLAASRELAAQLHPGDKNGSAAMNVWL